VHAVGSLIDLIHRRGPVTVAAFMDLALYHPTFGYYARAAQRSGRAGDFFTSVDVGPLFGDLLAVQFAEMFELLFSESGETSSRYDLVEAGAGNGRLAADVLNGLDHRAPHVLSRLALHLVEASPAAAAEQSASLGRHASRLASSHAQLPARFTGILFANELLDAFPVHQVVMRPEGLREVYVDEQQGELRTSEGPLSDERLTGHFEALGVALSPGWIAEVSLAAIDWVREAARRLERGFMVFVDYGHAARELYSVTHAQGTLTSFSQHRASGPETGAIPPWLNRPGEQDLTAHVDFTSIQRAAAGEGMNTIALLDQTYFVMGLVGMGSVGSEGSAESEVRSLDPTALPKLSNPATLPYPANLPNLPTDVRALKTLLMPGGLGSTMKILILGKGVGGPRLKGCSYRVRIT